MFINKCFILFICDNFIISAAGKKIDNHIKHSTSYITYSRHNYHQSEIAETKHIEHRPDKREGKTQMYSRHNKRTEENSKHL